MGLWVADGEKGLIREADGAFARIGPPAYALCAGGGRVYCACAGLCQCRDGRTGKPLFDFPLPPGVCALCLFGGMVCALSTEADCVAACDPATGQMLYSAPAGAYPRDLCPCGRLLAVAGGAAGEVLLMDEGLRLTARHRVPGAARAVRMLPRGLYVLCAAGEEEPASRLIRISPRGVSEEVYSDPRPPTVLCALPDGRCLAGCRESVALLRPDGRLLGRERCAYPARLRPCRRGVMMCDSWQGTVRLFSGGLMYRGGEPLDALLL